MKEILFLSFTIMVLFTSMFLSVIFVSSEAFDKQITDVHGYVCVLVALTFWVIGVSVMVLSLVTIYMDRRKAGW